MEEKKQQGNPFRSDWLNITQLELRHPLSQLDFDLSEICGQCRHGCQHLQSQAIRSTWQVNEQPNEILFPGIFHTSALTIEVDMPWHCFPRAVRSSIFKASVGDLQSRQGGIFCETCLGPREGFKPNQCMQQLGK